MNEIEEGNFVKGILHFYFKDLEQDIFDEEEKKESEEQEITSYKINDDSSN